MDAIVEHMAAAGLPQYTAALEANGYDSWSHLVALPRAELVEVAEELGMPKGHARRFVDSVMGRNAPAPSIVASAVQPRDPAAWRALLTLCRQMPEGLMAPHLRAKLHQLVEHAPTADAPTLVECIAALEDAFDADAIDWAARE